MDVHIEIIEMDATRQMEYVLYYCANLAIDPPQNASIGLRVNSKLVK